MIVLHLSAELLAAPISLALLVSPSESPATLGLAARDDSNPPPPPPPPPPALSTGAKVGITIVAALLAFALLIAAVSAVQRWRRRRVLPAAVARQNARARTGETSYVYGVGSGAYAKVEGAASPAPPATDLELDKGAESTELESVGSLKPAPLRATLDPGELGAWERF